MDFRPRCTPLAPRFASSAPQTVHPCTAPPENPCATGILSKKQDNREGVYVFELVKAGGWLMVPIIACSIAAMAIIFERF